MTDGNAVKSRTNYAVEFKILQTTKALIVFYVAWFARIVAAASMFIVAITHLRAIRSAQAILLYPDGGFGHTIIGPDWLRRLHPDQRHLTFFGTNYDVQRHNKEIADLWGEQEFVWVRQGLLIPRLGSIYDTRWSTLIFGLFQRFLNWYVPATPCYFSVEGLFAATPRPKWLDKESSFEGRYESRYYPLIEAKPASALHVRSAVKDMVSRAIKNRFGSDYRKRCALYLRHRGLGQPGDFSSMSRVMPDLDTHMPAIRILNDAGYQVLLTGDVQAPSAVMDKMKGGLVDSVGAGIDHGIFRLYAGTEVDVHIGCLSGGSAYLYATDIPALMLNAFAPGDAIPKTTVYYKWLFEPNGDLVKLPDLLGGRFYDHQLHGCQIEMNDSDEIVEAVDEFIKHLDQRPYGVDPADLGIDAPWIRAANGRLSPAWLKRYYQRVGRV